METLPSFPSLISTHFWAVTWKTVQRKMNANNNKSVIFFMIFIIWHCFL